MREELSQDLEAGEMFEWTGPEPNEAEPIMLPGPEPAYVVLASVPVRIHRNEMGDQMAIRVEGQRVTQVGHILEPGLPIRLPARELRDQFLAVTTFEQFGSFMQICGPFIDRQPGFSTQTVTFSQFKEWQAMTESWMLERKLPRPLPSLLPKREMPEPGSPYTFFTDPEIYAWKAHGRPLVIYMAHTALDVIAATIAADTWQGITYGKCPECGRLFEAGTFGGYEKRYCTVEHSRKAARVRARKQA